MKPFICCSKIAASVHSQSHRWLLQTSLHWIVS
jgi:hypothetical protein